MDRLRETLESRGARVVRLGGHECVECVLAFSLGG